MSLLLARLLAYPATISWTWWHRAGSVEYDGVPWPGEASAGTSSASTLDELTTPPTIGTALNGYDGARFSGSARLESAVTLGDVLGSTPAGWTYFAVYEPASLATAGSPTYDRPALIGDAGGWWGVAVDADGVTPFQPDGSNSNTIAAPTPAALTVGQPAIIVCRWTGTHLQVRVGATGSMTTGQVAMGAHYNPFSTIEGNAVFVGRNYASAAFIDGTLWEDALVPLSLSDGDVDAFCAELAARYGLGGATVTGTLSRTLEALRLAATATVRAAGSLAATLGSVVGAGTAGARVAGSLDRLLGVADGDGTAAARVAGTLDRQLGGLADDAQAAVRVAGTLDRQLGTLDADGTAQALVSGSLSATLGAGTCASTAAVAVTGSLDRTLGDATLAATCVVGSTATATLAATLGAVTVTATATVRVAGSCTAQLGAITGALTAAARVAGSCAATLGGLADDAQAAVRVAGTLDRALGSATLAASAVVPVVASVNAQLGWLTVASSAQVGSFISASLDRGLGAVTVTATATVRVGASVDVRLGVSRASATAVARIGASLDRALGTTNATGFASVQVRAQASATLGLGGEGQARVPVVASLASALSGLRLVATAILPPDVVPGDLRMVDAALARAAFGDETLAALLALDAELARLALGDDVLAALEVSDQVRAVLTFGVREEPYDVGDTAKVTMTFTVDAVPTNPTTVTLEICSPSGVKTTVTSGFTTPSTGVYEYLVDLTEAGTWEFFGTGTGAAKCAQPHDLFVRAKPF